MGRIARTTGPWPRRRKLSLVMVETDYTCLDCREVWTHCEVMPETDQPYGLDEDDLPDCECGGRLVVAEDVGKMSA